MKDKGEGIRVPAAEQSTSPPWEAQWVSSHNEPMHGGVSSHNEPMHGGNLAARQPSSGTPRVPPARLLQI